MSRREAQQRSRSLTLAGYTVELDLAEAAEPGASEYPVRTTVELTSTEPDTFLDFLGGAVLRVSIDGDEQPVRYDGARIQLTGLTPGKPQQVVVDGLARYSRSGEGLHRFVDPVDGNVYLYTHNEPADCRRVFPVFDQPDLKAPFTFRVIAPRDWEVLSNQRSVDLQPAGEDSGGVGDNTGDNAGGAGGAALRVFAPTPPMSSYLTCVAAGPYAGWHDQWFGGTPSGEQLGVPLGLYCRQSLASAFDPETLFTLTKQGLDFFHRVFDVAYPWGKYDQIFVPEYNIGAMENPGLVTYTDEGYVFESAATRAQYAGRANTLLHEMSHMWFGDLVTPRWWDELWLKESFADYMGALASAEATEFTDAWTPFTAGRKGWAYRQDQLPSTHPIAADIPDVEAAKQNFDGITYAKGASVLRQLVAYVGQDAFLAGTADYFRRHAFGNTTIADLIDALERSSGRSLAQWSRLWLQTSGLTTLSAEPDIKDGVLQRLWIDQQPADGVGTAPELPHRLAVGLYRRDASGRLSRAERFELDLTGERTEVPAAAGLPAPELIVVNDDDLSYAKVRLDPESLRTVADSLTAIDSSLTRAGLWASLWNACRDGILPATDYLAIVARQAPTETDSALQSTALGNAWIALNRYLPAAQRPAAAAGLAAASSEQMLAAAPGSDAQLTWARTLGRVTALHPDGAEQLRGWLAGAEPPAGLPLDSRLRWQWWTALAAAGHASVAELDAERDSDRSPAAALRHLEAVSSLPDPQLKHQLWQQLCDDLGQSNDELSARIAGFMAAGHAPLVSGYFQPYLSQLGRQWRRRSQELAQRWVEGLYPRAVSLTDQASAEADPEQHPVVAGTTAWLRDNPDAPGALRRLLIEQLDDTRRALHAQQATAGSAESAP
ncbi:aminopeptidase N [Nakamurella sp. DB0629]|uniref:Aminopeptidase N n=1 Tax=Nakamurella aerolata TaxID=1656892 RepID=A0A849A2J0_9ACTN|nr:aminopeptidase N [Nakamurella aerolata]NNG34297.1 aminopeptidase N [Nakamurella aerolata]